MILKGESNLKNRYYKFYKLEDDYSPIDFITDAKLSEIKITDYNVTDESDFGIINATGNYTYEELVSLYNEILENSENPEKLYITLFGSYNNIPLNMQIWPVNKSLSVISNTNNIDINKIIIKNKGRRL